MKIIVPVKSAGVIKQYIEAGADEFYGGIYDLQWQEKYGNMLEYNRRGNYARRANIDSWKELADILKICSSYGKAFYLTANALQISDGQKEDFYRLIGKFKESGGEHVIVSDFTLIPVLQEMGLKCTVSSCAGVRNHHSARFFDKIGCGRIIFPRDMTVKEMHDIAKQVTSIEYEAFLMNSGCKFLDGNCLGLHTPNPSALCDYCRKHDSQFRLRAEGSNLTEEERELLQSNKAYYDGLFRKACSCCMIYDLIHIVDSVKIVGRVGDEAAILKDILLTKNNIQTAETSLSRKEYLARMKKPGQTAEQCKDYLNCYYRTDMFLRDRKLETMEIMYQDFLRKNADMNLKDKVEYIGINLSEKAEEYNIKYKLYFNEKASINVRCLPFVKELQKRGMLRTLTQIQDTVNGDVIRYDIGLKDRTCDNMKAMIDFLSEMGNVSEVHKKHIYDLNQMCVSIDQGQDSGSLYFLGFIEQKQAVKAVKTHYLTRKCADPDRIDTKDCYEDFYYLSYLKKLGIEGFERVMDLAEQILGYEDCHLWMFGMDYFIDKENKYKIYIKSRNQNFIHIMLNCLRTFERRDFDMIEELELLNMWLDKHRELNTDGIAVSKNQGGKWCFNFYLQWK